MPRHEVLIWIHLTHSRCSFGSGKPYVANGMAGPGLNDWVDVFPDLNIGGWFQPAMWSFTERVDSFVPSHYRAPLRVDCASFAQHMCHDALTEGGVQPMGESTDFFQTLPVSSLGYFGSRARLFFVFLVEKSMFFGKSFPWQVVFPPPRKVEKSEGFLKRSVFNAAQRKRFKKVSPLNEVSISDFLRTNILGLAFFSTF